MRLLICRLLLTAMLVTVCCGGRLASAQTEPRRPLLESLLRGVLEEQIRRADRDRERDRPPATPPPQLENLSEIGAAFRSFERNIDRLASALSQASRSSNAAAKLYNQTLQLRTAAARAASLSQSANNADTIRSLAESVARDWRDLEFGLKETFVANRSLQNYIDSLNRDAAQISRLFSLTAQISQQDTIRELEAFSESIGHIVEDLDFLLRFSSERTDVTLATWRTRQLAKYIIVLLDETRQTNPDDIVREFRGLDKQWRELAVRLRGVGDRHLDTDIRRAEEAINNVRRQLRLPQELDRTELEQLVGNLKDATEGLFKSITLETLIDMPSPQTLLPAASEFYGLCEHFQLSLSQDFRRDNLVENYRSVEDSWGKLSRRLSSAGDRRILETMEDVDRAINTLRLLLGAPENDYQYDSQEATSSLTVLTRRLETEIARRVGGSTQYSSGFRRSLQQELSQLTQNAARLNVSSVRGISRTQLKREVANLAQQWSRAQMLLAKLQPRDRPAVALISSQISEQLLKLGAGS